MQRILAIQIKRIGDLVLTAPALCRLRREKPEAHLTLVTVGAAGQLVSCIPGIDEHLSYRSGRPNVALWSQIALGNYDVVLDFNGTDRAAFMAFLSRAGIRAGYRKRGEKFPRSLVYTSTCDASLTELHTVDHMMALLQSVGISSDKPEPLRLAVPDPLLRTTGELLADHGIAKSESYTVIHPGTARREKYWLAERWAEVADRVMQMRGGKVVITGGADAGERAHIKALKSALRRKSDVVDLAGRIGLQQCAAVISGAQLALGVDTAAMHLAAAFSIPQVVLYGPTNPYHWHPRHRASAVVLAGRDAPLTNSSDFEMRIGRNAMNLIQVDQVLDAVAVLPCAG